jgi:hypothetical protein
MRPLRVRGRSSNRWSFVAVLVIVAGAVGAFAIYAFGYRDTGSSGLGRAEKDRGASILHATVAGNSNHYIDDIRRTSPGHHLVRYRNIDHPSVRICVLDHVDLVKRQRIGKGAQAPCESIHAAMSLDGAYRAVSARAKS